MNEQITLEIRITHGLVIKLFRFYKNAKVQRFECHTFPLGDTESLGSFALSAMCKRLYQGKDRKTVAFSQPATDSSIPTKWDRALGTGTSFRSARQ